MVRVQPWLQCSRGLGMLALAAVVMVLWGLRAEAAKRPVAKSGDVQFEDINALMNEAVADQTIPGGVVLIGHHGKVVYRRAFGFRSLEPTREAMTVDTIFDLASLTKCIATTTSVLRLIEDGRVRLNDPVATYLPEFGQNGKTDITVRELLTHYSGLRPDLDLKAEWSGRETAFNLAMREKPAHPPGSGFVYSDINFETLGFLVEKVSSEPLNDFARDQVFKPLGMKDTGFLPPTEQTNRIAPTQYDEQHRMLRGVVHDPTARRMGGVAGHAGLFSTADDLSLFCEALLRGNRLLGVASIEKMSTPQQPANASNLRGLGWDIDSPFASNRGELLPVGSFGHTGFTGTSVWIDPVTDTYVILLSNAVHPNGGKSTVSLRARLATAVVHSLSLTVSEEEKVRLSRITGYNESMMAARRVTFRNGDVKTGIDVLEEHQFRELHADQNRPVRVGLVTNQTGIDRQGLRTVDVMAHAAGVKLVAIFSPEHGIAGQVDTTEIGNSKDSATGVPIYSVYGSSDAARRPTAESLAGLDEVVFDIQDTGVRYYTYESTLGYFIQAAAKAGKEIVVLDRPDPVGGSYEQGPVADAGRSSFVSYWQTPIRHGMTMGELARMFNSERQIGARLTVVAMEGWMRGDWFDSTGLPWVNPSPNMRSLNEATLYTGIGMIEGTNISVGRGTDTPFEVLGASWIDGKGAVELAQYLNAREIDGIRFVPVSFTPSSSNYANQKCGGVNLVVTDRNALDGPELGVEVVTALLKLFPQQYQVAALDGLMVNKATFAAIERGEDPRRLAEEWQDELERFGTIRLKYLLY